MARPSRHWSLRYGLPLIGLLFFGGAYVLAMYLALDVSRLTAERTSEDRDQVYIAIHLGLLVLATALGFAMGKWVNGLGVAFATLFLVVLATWMLTAQLGSFALACEGGTNDIIRHWMC